MPKNISEKYGIGEIAETVRETRTAMRLSQRELSARAGIAQAQISRFENGEVDLYLSTLVELARALDMDLRLVPRSALPAVTAAVRENGERTAERDLNRTMMRLRDQGEELGLRYPRSSKVVALNDAIHELHALAPALNAPNAASALQLPIGQLEELLRKKASPGTIHRNLVEATERIRDIRDIAAHADGFKQIRAYTLDDED